MILIYDQYEYIDLFIYLRNCAHCLLLFLLPFESSIRYSEYKTRYHIWYNVNNFVYVYKYIHVFVHTYTHTYIHTYIHRYIQHCPIQMCFDTFTMVWPPKRLAYSHTIQKSITEMKVWVRAIIYTFILSYELLYNLKDFYTISS